ncbi:Bacterial alpha-L-rhamnosidase [Streptomyces adustus]|uniref:alpha-L-rhamnosidase n=1 Tax=Streptomyces adustus TaxID=1609272 RepID=A0A5N8V5F2_9ACTN|nr:family 78 glycoside hydrolase catalytic domain [Streptomyces adustus]MPY30387.1 Bacterial alpha-L-rhamnosidase [Streptomyces adustus]
MSVPDFLAVEHLGACPLGLGERSPRLSWRLPEGTAAQEAYRILAEIDGTEHDTGWIEGGDGVLVAWPFAPLGSAAEVAWQVRLRTDLGESGWSQRAVFETGLLDEGDWSADWIRPREPEVAPAGLRPAYALRRRFVVDRPVRRARLYATAHGVYETFLDGTRIGDVELAPGYTHYTRRLPVQAYDVTALLAPGEVTFGALLSDGWFRGQLGIFRAADQWGERTAFLAQLEVEYVDGSVTVFGTDAGWEWRVSTLIRADLIAGVTEDRRGGGGANGPDAGWDPVEVAPLGYETLIWSPAPPVRRIEELRPRSVARVGDRQVVDLGQNINGWVRLERLGPEGTELTLTHGEALGPDGDVTTEHLKPAVPFLPEPLPAGQIDTVVSAGRSGDAFEPRHTTHGFQYVRIEGHPEELSPADLTGVVVHTDLRRTGWFSCSDERINRLHEAAVWSFRGNACEIPTDCPHRERAGWTGDWQLYVPTAAFLYDVAGFSAKWLADVAVEQWEDGTVANISPHGPMEGRQGPTARLQGSAGWGDAVVIVPWELYSAYGDERILADMWPSMVRWLERAERMAASGRHPARTGPRAPHERYLWDTGFHWGEWLEPGNDVDDFGVFLAADKSDVATAYLAHSAGLMARIAQVLGRPADVVRYRELAERVTAAWRAEFAMPDGMVRPATQANLARALAFGLVPEEHRATVVAQLVERIRAAGTHLATGFLATPLLLPTLVEHGRADLAYELLLQDSPPSWLHMIDRGASTIWERWNGIDHDGTPHESLNHYSKGAVISFLHRCTVGLRPLEPAYRRFRVAPVPGGGLTSASATLETPYGRIEAAWRIAAEGFRLEVTVPPGTSAEVAVPAGAVRLLGPGRHVVTP